MMPLVIQNLDVLDAPAKSTDQEDADPDENGENNANTNAVEEGEANGNVQVDVGEASVPLRKKEGAIIVVGDTDSVSSLDSADSFADDESDEEEDNRRRRKPAKQKPQIRNLSRFQQPSTREQPSRQARIHRSNRRRASEAPRAVSLDHGMLSPSKPIRQPTRESTNRSMPSLQRNHSNPELMSPKSQDKDDKTNSDMPTPRDSLASSLDKHSVRSLNCLDLFAEDEEAVGHAYPAYHQSYHHTTDLHKQTSIHSTGSRWQDDQSANTGSRWSASTGTGATGSRSMNTAQLDQLSTVPRFPRRQKTGEGIKHLREKVSQDSGCSSGTSKEPGGDPTQHHPTPKKRPQLPNRQKSFRRGTTMTMNEAAQAALAMASGAPGAASQQQQQPSPQQAPNKPRRTVSNDTSQTNFSRQKSLPNLHTEKKKYVDMLSHSLHEEPTGMQSPRLPERKASGHSSNPKSLLAAMSPTSQHTRLRRAQSDGGATRIARLLQDDSHSMHDESDSTTPSWHQHHNSISASMHSQVSRESSIGMPHNNSMTTSMHSQFSRESSCEGVPRLHNSMAASMRSQYSRETSFSTGLNDSSALLKMPRRQTSHEDMPPPANALAKKDSKQSNPMETPIEEMASNDSEEDEDDRRGMHLPAFLRGSSRQCHDSNARLPLRQMSVSERREDDDDLNDIFGSVLGKEPEEEKEDDPVFAPSENGNNKSEGNAVEAEPQGEGQEEN